MYTVFGGGFFSFWRVIRWGVEVVFWVLCPKRLHVQLLSCLIVFHLTIWPSPSISSNGKYKKVWVSLIIPRLYQTKNVSPRCYLSYVTTFMQKFYDIDSFLPQILRNIDDQTIRQSDCTRSIRAIPYVLNVSQTSCFCFTLH